MGTSSSKQLDSASHDEPAAPVSSEGASSCPVPESYRNPAIYNVYNQRINDPNAKQT